MARKPTEIAAVKIRVRESLRRNLAAEGKKAGRSLNQEMVRRLEQSFNQQGIEAIVESTALRVARELLVDQERTMRAVLGEMADAFNRVHRRLGMEDLFIDLKQEQGNG